MSRKGRPPNPPEERRAAHKLQLYFSGSEFAAMSETANERGSGMTVSAWAKATLLAALGQTVARRLGDVEEYRCPACKKSIWIPDANSYLLTKCPQDGTALERTDRFAAVVVGWRQR